jgi:hypothetical protein
VVWKERGHPHHHRAQSFVADVEIVVREAAALGGEDPVMRVLGGIFRVSCEPDVLESGRRKFQRAKGSVSNASCPGRCSCPILRH